MLKLCKVYACPNGTLGLHLSRAPWDPYPWVSGVQDGSNAYQAGVRSGDTVLELNGSDVLGQTISELATKIQRHWERGSSFVTILIWRKNNEDSAVNQQSLQKFAKCLQHIAQLLECPICLEIVKPPGWQCCNGHVLCNSCRGRTVKCPICRVTLGPRGRCLLSDKLFTLLAESFPCDGVKNNNSSSNYINCHEKKLISDKIDGGPPSPTPSPTLHKIHHRKSIAASTIFENLKKPDDYDDVADNKSQLALDNNNVVLKLNLKSKKKNDFMEHGSCYHQHQYQHPHKHDYHHHNRSHSQHRRQLLGQQQKTFHCPTGKSSCSLHQHNTSEAIIAGNNSRTDLDAKTLNSIWTQKVGPKPKGEEKIEILKKLITEWDVFSHLTQVHQMSVAHHYTTFGQPVRLQYDLHARSMPCISIQSECTWALNKENFKNNGNVSIGEVCLTAEGTEQFKEHTMGSTYKISGATSSTKGVHRPATELFFVACIPMDDDDDSVEENTEMKTSVDEEVNAKAPSYQCLQSEFDDTAGAAKIFVASPNGPCAGVIKTATKTKSTYSQTTSHFFQDPRSEIPSTNCQSRFNVELSPLSSRSSICTNSSKAEACTWCSSSSSSCSGTSSCSSSLASFSISNSSYRCCSNTVTRRHAIFIWYLGSDCDVKKFQTVIECKRTGIKWTGCVHPLTMSWSSIRRVGTHMQHFLVLNSMPDGSDNFFDIVIKIK